MTCKDCGARLGSAGVLWGKDGRCYDCSRFYDDEDN